jgi:hypothetical protein
MFDAARKAASFSRSRVRISPEFMILKYHERLCGVRLTIAIEVAVGTPQLGGKLPAMNS